MGRFPPIRAWTTDFRPESASNPLDSVPLLLIPLEQEDRIIVTFAVEQLSGLFHTCQSNDQVRVEVQLDEPIGERRLVDGMCLNGPASATEMCSVQERAVRWTP